MGLPDIDDDRSNNSLNESDLFLKAGNRPKMHKKSLSETNLLAMIEDSKQKQGQYNIFNPRENLIRIFQSSKQNNNPELEKYNNVHLDNYFQPIDSDKEDSVIDNKQRSQQDIQDQFTSNLLSDDEEEEQEMKKYKMAPSRNQVTSESQNTGSLTVLGPSLSPNLDSINPLRIQQQSSTQSLQQRQFPLPNNKILPGAGQNSQNLQNMFLNPSNVIHQNNGLRIQSSHQLRDDPEDLSTNQYKGISSQQYLDPANQGMNIFDSNFIMTPHQQFPPSPNYESSTLNLIDKLNLGSSGNKFSVGVMNNNIGQFSINHENNQKMNNFNLQGQSYHYQQQPPSNNYHSRASNNHSQFIPQDTSYSKVNNPNQFIDLQLMKNQSQPIQFMDETDGERQTGRLKFFDENKNYGFIIMDKDGSDIFVHFDDIQKAGISKDYLKTAKQGNQIAFSFSCMTYTGRYNKSRKAVELTLINNGEYQ